MPWGEPEVPGEPRPCSKGPITTGPQEEVPQPSMGIFQQKGGSPSERGVGPAALAIPSICIFPGT